MADKEIHHYSGGDGGGAVGIVVGVLLAAVLVVGGLFLWANSGGSNVAKAPSVSITTGQGGGSSK
jgi:hypothetical protein